MSNRLLHEGSCYMRQHADNPMDRYPWAEPFAKANREGKRTRFHSARTACWARRLDPGGTRPARSMAEMTTCPRARIRRTPSSRVSSRRSRGARADEEEVRRRTGQPTRRRGALHQAERGPAGGAEERIRISPEAGAT